MNHNPNILNSWKEIADYLDRDIRTCLRWEKKLGLPIHRYDTKSPRSKVFAYKSEIEQWMKLRTNGHSQEKPKIRIKQIFLRTGIIIVLISAGMYYFLQHSSRGPDFPTLAVFPFENSDPSLTEKYFSESMTYEIIDNFINSSRLRVIPAASVEHRSQIPLSREKIGKDLGADYFLQARVDKEFDHIKISAELLRTRDGKIVWEDQFEGNLNDIFSIQDTLCRNISQMLNACPEKKVYRVSENINTQTQALDSYLKGNFVLRSLHKQSEDPWLLFYQGKYYSGQNTRESNNLAISLFENAIDLDGDFAAAYFGLAECYINIVNMGWDPLPAWLDKAKKLIEQGHSINSEHPGYYEAMLKIMLLKDTAFQEPLLEKAFQLAREGIENHPYNIDIKSLLGQCHYRRYEKYGHPQDLEQSLIYKEQSFLQEPFGIRNIIYAELLMLEGEFSQAIQVCEFAAKHDTSFLAKFRLGEIFYYAGDTIRSDSLFNSFIDSHFNIRRRIDAYLYLAMTAASQGNQERALQLMDKINRLSSPGILLTLALKTASVYAGLGFYDFALENLDLFFGQQQVKDSPYIFLKYIEADSNFRQLRMRDDFEEHLQKWRNRDINQTAF